MSEITLDAYVIGNVDVMRKLEAWLQERNKSTGDALSAEVSWLEGDVLHFPADQADIIRAGIQDLIDSEKKRLARIERSDTNIKSPAGFTDLRKTENLVAEKVSTCEQHEAAIASLEEVSRKLDAS